MRPALPTAAPILLLAALLLAATPPGLARDGTDPIDAAELDRGVRALIDEHGEGVRVTVWLGGTSGDPWYSLEADAVRPTASAIKTAYLVALFHRFADALDAPPPGLDEILADDHPAMAPYSEDRREEIREALRGATVREIGGLMMGSIPAPNHVYNAAASVATAVLGGPEGTTAAILALDPSFDPIVARRYMLAPRDVTGDNEASAAALAAVLRRLAARDVPGLEPGTIEAIREATVFREDSLGVPGPHWIKNGALDSDPITRVKAGWWEAPGVGPVVYVAMLSLSGPVDGPRDEAAGRLEETARRLATLVLESVRDGESTTTLNREQASAFARLALEAIVREYPNKPEHVLGGPEDVESPRALHPAFFGSYDWHSSVHGHWMLARVLRLFPDLPEADRIREVLGSHLTAEHLRAEADYFARQESRSFERPYGWAWLLKLAEELDGWDDPDAKRWRENLRPLEDVIVARYLDFFPKQTYPIRTGVHPNTAFGLAFAHDHARAVGDDRLRMLVEERARSYFEADTDAPASWEPSGADFFSPTLMEADLMRRVLPPGAFRDWFGRFLPGASRGEPASLFDPAEVTDRTDPQLVHLDGLNLSRAWCMRSIAAALPEDDPARRALAESSDRHAASGLEHVASGSYEGEHWLASFAVYLLAVAPAD